MKIKLFFAAVFLSISASVSAQTYFEPYTSNAGWQTAGGGTIKINNGLCRFEKTPDDSGDRVFKQIPFTLNDNGWKAEFMFKPYDNSFGTAGPAHFIWGVTAGPQDPTNDGGATAAITDQDGIMIDYGYNLPSDDPNPNNWMIGVYVKDGQNRIYFNTQITSIAPNEYSYFTLERISKDNCRLSIFKDRAKTIQYPNSPFTFPAAASVISLTYLQHSNFIGGSPVRQLTADIDTTIITN